MLPGLLKRVPIVSAESQAGVAGGNDVNNQRPRLESSHADLALHRPHLVLAQPPHRPVRVQRHAQRRVPERLFDADTGLPRRGRDALVPSGRRQARRKGEMAERR